jgi:hypothetical protein
MAEEDKFHVGKPPVYDGNNYDYWKKRMEVHFKALGRDLWNEKFNDRALSVLYNALAISEFNRVKGLEKSNEIWEKLMEIYEGTSTVKETKLYVYKGKFNVFTMKKDEDVSTMFNRLNDIVNELRCLDFIVTNKDISHTLLRWLSEKYERVVTLLVRTDLNKMTPTEVLGEVQTHDLFKQSQKEVQGQSISEEKKNITLKAKATQEENDDENQEIDSEEMTLIARGLKRIMKKKKFGKMGQSSKKNPFECKDCFNCGEIGHISTNCCETWVPLGPHRPGSRPSPTSGSGLPEDPSTCQWVQPTWLAAHTTS